MEKFKKKWSNELRMRYTIDFFQKIVPKYFSRYVIPVTPPSQKIIDIGCGTGILAKCYAEHSSTFKHIIGIDINPYPEWKLFGSKKVSFKVVNREKFPEFLRKEKPDSTVLTWTLHHMKYDEQERYLDYIRNSLPRGAKILILEDSYSTHLIPENGKEIYNQFMKWEPEERKKIMSIYDWVANRILAQRSNVPMPFTYRTLEDWNALLDKHGFKTIVQKFIGFPNNRDVNTPQCLIVARKK